MGFSIVRTLATAARFECHMLSGRMSLGSYGYTPVYLATIKGCPSPKAHLLRLAKRIKAIRAAKGWSQEAPASELLGRSRVRWEQSSVRPLVTVANASNYVSEQISQSLFQSWLRFRVGLMGCRDRVSL